MNLNVQSYKYCLWRPKVLIYPECYINRGELRSESIIVLPNSPMLYADGMHQLQSKYTTQEN